MNTQHSLENKEYDTIYEEYLEYLVLEITQVLEEYTSNLLGTPSNLRKLNFFIYKNPEHKIKLEGIIPHPHEFVEQLQQVPVTVWTKEDYSERTEMIFSQSQSEMYGFIKKYVELQQGRTSVKIFGHQYSIKYQKTVNPWYPEDDSSYQYKIGSLEVVGANFGEDCSFDASRLYHMILTRINDLLLPVVNEEEE